jgi:hypothetical protein
MVKLKIQVDIWAVMIASGLAYVILNAFLPFAEGRDAATYYLYFKGIFEREPVYPVLMLFRTPFTPLFFGISFDLFGRLGPQIALGFGYVVILTLAYKLLSSYSKWAGVVCVVLITTNLRLFEYYNTVGSEGPQTILLMIWAYVAFRAMKRSGVESGVLLGLATFLLVINRPANQLLLVGCFLPLLGGMATLMRRDNAFKKRIVCSLVSVGVGAGLTFAYMGYNLLRYDHFCVARLGGASIPFYRVFLEERLIRPSNGPKCEELADLVRRKILSNQTIRQYGVDEETFFRFSTSRMFDELFRACAEERGWDHDFGLLRDSAWEAARANPKEFWLGYINGVCDMFQINSSQFLKTNRFERDREFDQERQRRYVLYASINLPIPSEGDFFPSTGCWLLVKPQGSRTHQGKLAIFTPQAWDYKPRPASSNLIKKALNWSTKFSSGWFYLLIGIVGMYMMLPGDRDPRLLLITIVSTAVLLATWFGVTLYYYRLPHEPIYTMLFCYGMHSVIKFVSMRVMRSSVSHA